MKKIFLLSVLFIAALFVQAQKKQKLLTELGLKGPVKTMSVRTFEALDNFGKPEKGERVPDNADYTFLNNGDITEQNIYNNNGSLRTRHEYKYNSAGKLTEQNLYNPGGPLRIKFKYKYNSNGYLSEQQSFKPDGSLTSYYTYEYDKMGREINYKWYDSKGLLGETTKYHYDSSGNQTGWDLYDEHNKLVERANYVYDLYGNMTEETLFDVNDSLESKKLMTYDQDKRMTALVEVNSKNIMVKTVQYKHDAQDNIEEELWYNRNNNEVLDTYQYKITYDKKKNWVKIITYRNRVPVTIAEREITYFK